MTKHNAKLYKQKLIEALEKSLGIVSAACKEVGISRDRFYTYYNEDEEFRKKVDDVSEITLDFVETQLFKAIKEGNDRAILFYMKYKGKKRGYTDNIDITSNGGPIKSINIIELTRNIDEDKDES